ncbi:MAG TPA: HEAT repeat domain-containing protein [Pyrinomonadaceae bacterium]|nr:HEAT repeat domain-containing protein [Pyrinomonadaceae bacterium]
MILTLLTVFLLTFAQAEQRFTPVEGATLQAKQEAAARQAAASGQTRYWTAYSFDVRPGVAVDVDYVSDDGSFRIQGTWESSVRSLDPSIETRSLGVFLLRDSQAGGGVVRLSVYNLARRHEYGGYPVYWMGRASNDESLAVLRALAEGGGAYSKADIASEAVGAIALHDDRRAPEVLVAVARASTDKDVRARAARALGQQQPPAQQTRDFLAQLARDERESQDVRRAAILAYARARDPQALTFLQGLYASLQSEDLKRTTLSGVARNENRASASAFVVRVATTDSDLDLRREAVKLMGEIAAEQTLGALRDAAPRTDDDTELQKQALAAIGKRPASESVPLLINVARMHQKPELRRHAFILLGRTGGDAAVEFLKGVLAR